MPSKKLIYLDNSATTPADQRVVKAMLPYLTSQFGNASSIHLAGLEALKAVDESKAKIAHFLACLPAEVYFTSGATESDNLAVLGLIKAIIRVKSGLRPHFIVSAIEHEAILAPAKHLAKSGVEFSLVPVDSGGLVDLVKLKSLIRPNTVLISIMALNNEVGTIEPIAEIGQMIKELNSGRENKIYFHTDATQAPAYLDLNVDKLGVDLLSLSGHKIYGPKGIGLLYVRKGTPLVPLFFGGHQQGGVRSGTYNVPGIVGLAKALELLADKTKRKQENKKIKNLRDYLIKSLKKKIPGTIVTGDLKNRAEGNASFIFPGVEGESILLMLSQKGIAVSTGSACSSGSLEPSHVLLAMGFKPELAHGSLRVTLGRFNLKKDADALIKYLPPIIKKLRGMSPLK